MKQPVCLMSYLGLESSERKWSVQYAFDFSGRGETTIDPFLHDFSRDSTFYLDDGGLSFDFRKLKNLLPEETSRSDMILIQGSISLLIDKDGHFEQSSHRGETYFLRVGDIPRVKSLLPQSQKTDYVNHSVVGIFYRNGKSFVADVGL